MRRFALPAAMLIGVAVAAGPAGAHDPSAELDAVRDQLDALAAQIDNSKEESRVVGESLSVAQSSLATVQAELAEAEGRVDEVAGRIAGEEDRLEGLQRQLEAIELNLLETTVDLQNTLADLEIQVVELYMNAAASVPTLVLGFSSATEAAVGLAYVDEVTGQSEDLLDSFEFLKIEEERQQGLVVERQDDVHEAIVVLESEKSVLEAEAAVVEGLRLEAEANLAEVRSLLDRINADIAAAEQSHESLEADAQRLESEIAALQDQGGSNPGVLGWPVNGPVTSPYGYRTHPIFGTQKLHTGIDIGAGSGAAISASGSGRVILAESYGGYGNAVVIDHGGGLATLYAHQSRIAVSFGQQVSRGDTIGYVGCTGYCTGPHLHFETREFGLRVDPMKYLNG